MLDLLMPAQDGDATIPLLRDDLPDVPIGPMTGVVSPGSAADQRTGNRVTELRKPFTVRPARPGRRNGDDSRPGYVERYARSTARQPGALRGSLVVPGGLDIRVLHALSGRPVNLKARAHFSRAFFLGGGGFPGTGGPSWGSALCEAGRLPGAYKLGREWRISAAAVEAFEAVVRGRATANLPHVQSLGDWRHAS